MKALILSAGFGTRLKPITDSIPKALVEVNGKPMLQRTIECLQKQGINDFVINIHYLGNLILGFLKANKNFGANIEISDETDLLLDTGGAIKNAEKFLANEEYFLIHNVDIFSEINIAEMEKMHIQSSALVTLATQNRKASRKLGFDKDMNLKAWRNFNTNETILADDQSHNLNFLAFSGIQIASSDIFKLLPEVNAPYPIIPEYLRQCSRHSIKAFLDDAPILDMGSIDRIKTLEKYLAK